MECERGQPLLLASWPRSAQGGQGGSLESSIGQSEREGNAHFVLVHAWKIAVRHHLHRLEPHLREKAGGKLAGIENCHFDRRHGIETTQTFEKQKLSETGLVSASQNHSTA